MKTRPSASFFCAGKLKKCLQKETMLSLAPIVVEILMARGSGHKITSSVHYRSGETESGTTRVVRKNVLLLKKKHEWHECIPSNTRLSTALVFLK
jgi:hypothetical protein